MNRTWTDRYEERGLLGASGFGAVYRAWDRVLWREVAIKTLRPDMVADAALRQQFLAEAQALAALRHPNIVDVYDLGESDHGPYFAMELLQGRTLADTLAATGRMEPRRVVRVVRSLADALDHTHAAGIVHGDVKPLNVMIETSGRVVLFDYGIATAIESDAAAGHVVGTPAYMAPEVARGERGGPAADIYALAVLTYQALSGRTPFDGAARDVLQAQIEQTPPALATVAPDLPAALSEVVMAALAKEPHRRPASAGAFAAALGRAADRPPARGAGARSAASADATPSGGFTEAFTLRAAAPPTPPPPAPAALPRRGGERTVVAPPATPPVAVSRASRGARVLLGTMIGGLLTAVMAAAVLGWSMGPGRNRLVAPAATPAPVAAPAPAATGASTAAPSAVRPSPTPSAATPSTITTGGRVTAPGPPIAPATPETRGGPAAPTAPGTRTPPRQ